MRNDEFLLEYQPIWNIDRTAVVSLEALIRWQHPEKGMIYPCDFIPLAEESNLIHEIGDWVIDRSCAMAKILQSTFTQPPKVSINVSSLQFMRGGIDQKLKTAMSAHELDGSALIVEITESVLLIDQQNIEDQLLNIEAMGIQLSVDDFGTGFSSLSYLKKYPIQCIKIDRSFIQDLESDPEDRALVSGIISLADSLSLKTVMEGVETDAQLALIRQYGDPMIQGFLYSKPMKGDKAIDLLADFLELKQ